MTDTAHSGVYVGTNGIRLGKGVFSVDNNGKVTASNLNITGGTITIKDGSGSEAFKVTSTGAVTAKNLTLNGGSINLGDGVFKVTSAGAVTASNLSINGGSIKIGSNFNVTNKGNVTANNMRLTGTLTVGGSTITADNFRLGAERANNGYQTWNGTTSTVNEGKGGWNGAAVSTSAGGFCYGGAVSGNHAYSRAAEAWIGEYRLNFGSGIAILGTEFTDSTGERCDGVASRSNVVTATYAGGYD